MASYAVTPPLPAGLLLNTSTGTISGNPSVITATADYIVTASNASGSTTAILSITVNPPAPTIATQPVNQSVEVGQAATFNVVAAGTGPLHYLWRKNSTLIPDATTEILTLPSTQLADNGALISVVVSDTYGGSVSSTDATLTVLPLPVSRVILNELCAANASILIPDTPDYHYRNYTEWVEIANTGSGDVDLAGYSLTNNLAVPDKWVIPAATVVKAGKAVIFWADGLGVTDHMNFKLSINGGTMALFSPAKELINSVTYPAQVTDTSYGVIPGGGTPIWRFQATPTPGKSNSGTMVDSATRAAGPTFSLPPGFHPAATTVTISADSSASIRYTTDGSIPTLVSTLYTTPIPIPNTIVLKARTFTTNTLPSLVTVGTYFIGEASTLPVVSVSTNPENLWANDTGIYVLGSNASPIPPYFGANFWHDWERPTHVELLEGDGTRGFSYFGALKINGNTTCGVPEKSLSFAAKAKYDGLTTFTYPLFPDKPTVTSYPRFLVRNSGQDWPRTLFRDALTARVIQHQMKVDAADTGLDYQAYRPVLHYLNGQYNGIINLREKADAYFPVSNWGATAGKVDFLEYEGATLLTDDGSAATYTSLIAFLQANDITVPATYAEVKTRMDVEEFMNYVIVETFIGNYDWPASNTKFWRSQTAGAKWRWILQDTDFAWGYESEFWTALDASLDCFQYLLDPVGNPWPNPPEGTFLFRSLIQNTDFRARFLAKYQQHLDTTFQPLRIQGIIDSIQAALEPEMQRQIDKWGGQLCGLVGSDYKYPTSKAEWLQNVAQVRAYVDYRPAYVRAHLANHFPGGGLVP